MYVFTPRGKFRPIRGCRDPGESPSERQRGIAGSILGRELYDPLDTVEIREIETFTDELKAFAKNCYRKVLKLLSERSRMGEVVPRLTA
jgi:hypothetical protein